MFLTFENLQAMLPFFLGSFLFNSLNSSFPFSVVRLGSSDHKNTRSSSGSRTSFHLRYLFNAHKTWIKCQSALMLLQIIWLTHGIKLKLLSSLWTDLIISPEIAVVLTRVSTSGKKRTSDL